MKKRNGFTLIELLAVIVILAIIALIAVPVILNIIDKANKSALKDTAYGVISAGELYFSEQQLELNGMEEDVEFTFPTDEIDIKGNVPNGTVLKVNTRGEIALAMSNGRYCVTKGYGDADVTLTEDVKYCVTPGTVADILIGSTELSLAIGQKFDIEVNIKPSNAINKQLTYTSSKTSVATVSETGEIEALAPGTTKITIATTDGSNIKKTINVTVNRLVQSIYFDQAIVAVGLGSRWENRVRADVLPKDASIQTLTWTSADPSIATVSVVPMLSGISEVIITGVSLGTTTVTATATDGSNISKTINVTVSEVQTNGIMQSANNCINEGICPNGTKVKVAVNNQRSYDFYTIKDDGNTLTLISSSAFAGEKNVEWINETDYKTENNKDEIPDTCKSKSCNDEGPITAINYIDGLTDEEWSNVPKREYTYSGLAKDGTTRIYEDITRTMRARMITYGEVETIKAANNGTMPSYIDGTHWTSTAIEGQTASWTVDNMLIDQNLNRYPGIIVGEVVYNSIAVRPVIELSK